ncbi:MAG: N-acetylmuramoyl-L-alanine amidase [Verrucomicrobia bacterium]|nr:N-acetylmuramoyl-L-alanine amidase [Verrucomicrobiota bacterium]
MMADRRIEKVCLPLGQWRGILGVAACCLWLLSVSAQAGVSFVSKWSPRNANRPERSATLYIVLHTTEGPTQGSLQKVYDNGEANFFVDPAGRIYGIVDRRRVAFHAGRSMWKGRRNLDDVSVGIEVSGYHTRDITTAQYKALRALLEELQAQYNIADANVLTHSMVAYGAPNVWHKRSHRGRKRCGMQFGTEAVRQKLGLQDKHKYDPDVRAGRLSVGDSYLAEVLYGGTRHSLATAPAVAAAAADKGAKSTPRAATADVVEAGAPSQLGGVITLKQSAWDVARGLYNDRQTRYVFPDGKTLRGDQIQDWKMIPPGTRVFIGSEVRDNPTERVMRVGQDGASAQEVAGEEFNAASTIYFLPDGRVRTGAEISASELAKVPTGTGMLVGYTVGGSISAKRSAFVVCGVKWNHPSTFYRLPDGKIVSGDSLTEGAIPSGAKVFFRN